MKQQWQFACVGLVSVALLVSACSPSSEQAPKAAGQAASKTESAEAPLQAEAVKAASQKPATFINKVWKVEQSNAVAAGQLYAFLSDGTLVITAPQQKPALGTWSYQAKKLVMTEEGIAYPVDILALSENSFSIRMHSPGDPVDIQLVDASVDKAD